jgi:hypothetical protein
MQLLDPTLGGAGRRQARMRRSYSSSGSSRCSNLSRRSNGCLVVPCTSSVNSTTPKVITRTRSRSATPLDPAPWFIFKDGTGQTLARLSTATFLQAFQDKMIQVMPQDIEATLYETIHDTVPIRFSSPFQQLDQKHDQVKVTFTDGAQEAFDLLIGADGLHSNVRRLVFDDKSKFAIYLGYYFAAFPVPNLDHFEEGAIIHLERTARRQCIPTITVATARVLAVCKSVTDLCIDLE